VTGASESSHLSATVRIIGNGRTIYRLHIDPRCLTIGAERGVGPKLHLNHVGHCRCGDFSQRLTDRGTTED